ncbi:hypothetical protein AB0M44_37440 [Streptosporangium subroseum]|uniref:hypothetical protein n=1 Tax=Streptosporangium subroseum TaxID=106412 RepID=UPI003415E310
MPLISVRAAVVFGAAFVCAVIAATLMVIDGNSLPAAAMAAATAFGGALALANMAIGSRDDRQESR